MISYENQTPYGEGDAAIEAVWRKLLDYASTWRVRLTEATEDHAKNQLAFDEALKAQRASLTAKFKRSDRYRCSCRCLAEQDRQARGVVQSKDPVRTYGTVLA